MDTQSNERSEVGVGIVVVRGDKILIGERLFETAARREVQEESGLSDLEVKAVVSVGNDIAYGKHYVSIGILAECRSGEPFSTEDTSRNWFWRDPRQLPEPMFPHSKKVIQNWLAGKLYSD